MSLARLAELKRAGKKIVAVVAWDTPMARIADAAGVDLVSVGDSVGVNLWGQKEGEITVDELLVVAKAVRRGVKRALVSCDLPPGQATAGALRLVREAGVDMVKVFGVPATVRAVVDKGIAVFAEMHGDRGGPDELVAVAKRLEAAGATMIDFRHSGPVAGAAVAQAVGIPVIGGLGGGPWLDGRVRMVNAAIGYSLEAKNTYANVGQIALEALKAYADDVRNEKPLRNERA